MAKSGCLGVKNGNLYKSIIDLYKSQIESKSIAKTAPKKIAKSIAKHDKPQTRAVKRFFWERQGWVSTHGQNSAKGPV